MYIWLVLSTFLAILAGFSLPINSSIENNKSEKIGSAFVSRLLISHKISLEYVKKNKWPYYCEGAEEGAILGGCSDDKMIGYAPDVISQEELASVDADDFNYDENYISQIFCYDQSGEDAENCKNESGVSKSRYLVTFGDIHMKWLTSDDMSVADARVTPKNEVLQGFRSSFAEDVKAGYVVEESGVARIYNGWGTAVFTFPELMWIRIKNSNNCNKDFNGSCVVYVSMI